MTNSKSVLQSVKGILFLTKGFYYKLSIVALCILLNSLIEILSIGLIIPVIHFFFSGTNPIQISENNFFSKLNFIITHGNSILHLLLIVGIVFTVKFLFTIYSKLYINKILSKINLDLNQKLIRIYLNQDYSFFIKENTSQIINTAEEANGFVQNSLSSIINLFADLLLAFLIIVFLLYLYFFNSVIIIIALLFLFSFYFIFTKNKLLKLGEERVKTNFLRIKNLQQVFSGIREVKLFNLEKNYLKIFNKIHEIFFNTYAIQQNYRDVLRPFFEFVFIIFVLILIFFSLLFKKNSTELILFLTLLSVCAIRLLPITSRVIYSIQTIKFKTHSIDLLIKNFKLNIENEITNLKKENNNYAFQDSIIFENVYFNYPESKNELLNNINIVISKRDHIGIIGESGAGKSTFIDLFCGLLRPSSGIIKIDGKDLSQNILLWQKLIGYVPQNIHLIDDTIISNIAYGIEEQKIDLKFLDNIINMSNLRGFVSTLPEGLLTIVGERGVKLSGGQKQRIGIARALYKKPEILILDEGTNALDVENEKEIIQSLQNFSEKTLIFVSHRPEILKSCNKIFFLDKGTLSLQN